MRHKGLALFAVALAFLLAFTGSGEARNRTRKAKYRHRTYREEKITLEVTGNVQRDIDRLLDRRAFRGVAFGVKVVGLENGQTLYKRNNEQAFTPASNTKLFTTATALERLRPNFTFRTILFRNGEVDSSGVLRGNLVIVGTGDPTLSANFWGHPLGILDVWADSLRNQGIRAVAGDIIGEDVTPAKQPAGVDSFDEEGGWSTQRMGGLVFDENRVVVRAVPGATVGDTASIDVQPPLGFAIKNKVSTIATQYVWKREKYRNKRGRMRTRRVKVAAGEVLDVAMIGDTLMVSGAVGNRSSVRSTQFYAADPARNFAAVLTAVLRGKGIEVQGQPKSRTGSAGAPQTSPLVPVAGYSSPPLSEFVKIINKESNNFYAECLLRTIGAEVKGSRTAQAGLLAESDFLKEIGLKQAYFEDGCGRSHGSSVSPDDVLKLLRYMHTRPSWDVFYGSLAVAGMDGTLRGRMTGAAQALGNVHAKTGTIRGVSALSGYVLARNGKMFAFSILVNDTRKIKTARRVEDYICEILAQYFGEQG
jgi:D-alanyl-D-alanine carboxypeptidase/D-alanyl-D-alanine-endopeptidase (penicillin-binding protein 4)